MEESIIAIIARKDFYAVIYNQGKGLETLLQILYSRLRDSWGKIQVLSFSYASQRLRMLFPRLSCKYGKQTDAGTTLTIRLTHQNIGNMNGRMAKKCEGIR